VRGDLVTSWVTISFSMRTQFHGARRNLCIKGNRCSRFTIQTDMIYDQRHWKNWTKTHFWFAKVFKCVPKQLVPLPPAIQIFKTTNPPWINKTLDLRNFKEGEEFAREFWNARQKFSLRLWKHNHTKMAE
jgi:hypothetical protein